MTRNETPTAPPPPSRPLVTRLRKAAEEKRKLAYQLISAAQDVDAAADALEARS